MSAASWVLLVVASTGSPPGSRAPAGPRHARGRDRQTTPPLYTDPGPPAPRVRAQSADGPVSSRRPMRQTTAPSTGRRLSSTIRRPTRPGRPPPAASSPAGAGAKRPGPGRPTRCARALRAPARDRRWFGLVRPRPLRRHRLELPARRCRRRSSGERCLALTGDSAAVPAWDRADAAAAADEAGRHGARPGEPSPPRSSTIPATPSNPRSRCYFCKLEVYGAAAAIARAEGYAWVVDGTNASDTGRADRPGMTAASELGVRSPLAEAGIDKEQLRALARSIGVDGWDRPASACLASRIPFGELDHGRAAAAGRGGRTRPQEPRLPPGARPRLRQPCPGGGRGRRSGELAESVRRTFGLILSSLGSRAGRWRSTRGPARERA